MQNFIDNMARIATTASGRAGIEKVFNPLVQSQALNNPEIVQRAAREFVERTTPAARNILPLNVLLYAASVNDIPGQNAAQEFAQRLQDDRKGEAHTFLDEQIGNTPMDAKRRILWEGVDSVVMQSGELGNFVPSIVARIRSNNPRSDAYPAYGPMAAVCRSIHSHAADPELSRAVLEQEGLTREALLEVVQRVNASRTTAGAAENADAELARRVANLEQIIDTKFPQVIVIE